MAKVFDSLAERYYNLPGISLEQDAYLSLRSSESTVKDALNKRIC